MGGTAKIAGQVRPTSDHRNRQAPPETDSSFSIIDG